MSLESLIVFKEGKEEEAVGNWSKRDFQFNTLKIFRQQLMTFSRSTIH